jgi:hypothetical protein
MRSSNEAHLYLELRLCRCGERGFRTDSAVIMVNGELASRYTGNCPACGVRREYVFLLPEDPTLELDPNYFGGESPSELLDPGEWLWVSDQLARELPTRPAALDGRRREDVREDLLAAAATVAEVVKFVPPGADAVPERMFRTEASRTMLRESPNRFHAGRLRVLSQTYVDMAAHFAP